MHKKGDYISFKKIETVKPNSNVKVGSIIEGILLYDMDWDKNIVLIDYTVDGVKLPGNLITSNLTCIVNGIYYHTRNSVYEKL